MSNQLELPILKIGIYIIRKLNDYRTTRSICLFMYYDPCTASDLIKLTGNSYQNLKNTKIINMTKGCGHL